MKNYAKIDHFCKVFYTEDKGRHRPYLELVFSNSGPGSLFDPNSLVSPKTLGLIDSGADHTAIPYSIGRAIKLESVKEGEKLMVVGGVGGNINCVERKCSIFVANQLKREVYKFDETVWWKVPSPQIEKTLDDLIKNLTSSLDLQKQALLGTVLYKHFQEQINQIKAKIFSINATLEGGILIGRPFFDNFEFIQFNHSDRVREDKCFFNYKVRKNKIAGLYPLGEYGDPPIQINTMGIV